MLPLIFLLMFSLMNLTTSVPTTTTKFPLFEISGGIETEPHQYPWMVRLQGCGGSLISDRHVLTARHCVERINQTWVQVGVHNQYDENVQEIPVLKAVWPDYENPREHDIAIIILAEPVTFTEKVRPIRLPASDNQEILYVGQHATHTGWGMTGVGSGQSAVLNQAEFTVSDVTSSKYYFYTDVYIDNLGRPVDPCAGDSGGPLMYQDPGTGRWTIIGTVVGGGYDCRRNTTNGDGKWNKVAAHLDWIKKIVGEGASQPKDDRCYEEPMVFGPCEGYFPRFSYNQKSGKCEEFGYGGCEGNRNRFDTLEECDATCNEPDPSPVCLTTTKKKCIFPFVYNGQTFNSCTNFNSKSDWCATEVDSNNAVVKKQWADCDPQTCPSDGNGDRTANCVCGLKKIPEFEIFGGNETLINEFGWVVGLTFPLGKTPFCGGSLINDRWILTAAHCMVGRTNGDIQVLLGEHDVRTTEETTTIRRNVTRIENHPEYTGTKDPKYDYDYSLLKLSTPIDFSQHPHIRPVCLPENSNTGPDPDYVGGNATVAGWGHTKHRGWVSKVLQKVTVKIHSTSDCQASIPESSSFKVTDRMICAGVPNGKQDACQGDSGGPLFYSSGEGLIAGENYEQTGVVSVGFGCGRRGRLGIYSKVSYIKNWIMETTEGEGIWCPRE